MNPIVDERMRMQEIRDQEQHAYCAGAPMQQTERLLPLHKGLLDEAMSLAPKVRDPGLLKSICQAMSEVLRPSTNPQRLPAKQARQA
jgi:hypothetical protein